MSEINSRKQLRYFYDPTVDVCYCRLGFLGFPGYCIGDDGTVWTGWKRGGGFGSGKGSFVRGSWREMRPTKKYYRARFIRMDVCFGHNKRGAQISHSVHSLVLLAFVGPRPAGMIARHFPDRNPMNNSLTNLRYGTYKENAEDRDYHETTARGEKNRRTKYPDAFVWQLMAEDAVLPRKNHVVSLAKRHGMTVITIRKLLERGRKLINYQRFRTQPRY